MWYRQRLAGDYEISYRICMVMQGGKYDRLSDLNCFWAANDPKYPDDLFAVVSGVTASLKTTIH